MVKRILFSAIFAALLTFSSDAAFIGGVGPTSGFVPNVTAQVFAVSSPTTTGQTVGTPSSSGGPTSWSLVSQTCSNYFAVNASTGQITITSTGSAALNGSAAKVVCDVTITASNAIGTSAPELQTINAYADGSVNAPSCSVQYPALLSSYSVRAPWKVAGVDYCVGYPSSTVLTDWQTCLSNLQTAFGAGNFTTTGSNPTSIQVRYAPGGITWNACDFTLHGGALVGFVSSPNGTITNSRFGNPTFATGAGSAIIVSDSNSPNLTVKNNVFDWGLTSPGQTGVNIQVAINSTGGGNTTIQYNWFGGCGADPINTDNLKLAGVADIRFNLFDTECTPSGVHMNWVSWGSGTVNSPLVSYNTGYQTNILGAEGIQYYFNGSGTFSNPSLTNNTEIALFNASGGTMSNMNHGSNAGGTGITVVTGIQLATDNFVDPSGTANGNSNVFYGGSFLAGQGNAAWTCSGNTNMVNGTTPAC